MSTKKYGSRLTNAGALAYAQAQINNEAVGFSYVVFGDGAGMEQEPDPARDSLVNQKYSAPITSIYRDANNPAWVIVEAVIPANVGGFYLREWGINGSDNTLLVIGNYPATYKATAAGNNVVTDLLFKVAVQTTSDAETVLMLAPSEVYVTQTAMLQAFTSHKEDISGHNEATTQLQGFAQYATIEQARQPGSQVQNRAVTPAGLQAALQGLTDAMPDDSMPGHLLAPDPHSQYLTESKHAEIHKGQRASRYFYANF